MYNQARYERQMILPGFGEQGQAKLQAARVLVIGAGGLGCPALSYLAAAGVGTIGIVDGDSVLLHNLHRQVLFAEADIGKNKALAAAAHLSQLNADIRVLAFPCYIDVSNAEQLLEDFDIIVDGSDNFQCRYLVNDAVVLKNKILVQGAVSAWEGQVAVFTASLHYRDLFPEPPPPGSIPHCGEAGVIGYLPGLIGALMAGEVIQLITGLGSWLRGKILVYDALHHRQMVLDMPAPKEHRNMPADMHAFRHYNYAFFCGADAEKLLEPHSLFQLMKAGDIYLVDVREYPEAAREPLPQSRCLPLSAFDPAQLPDDDQPVVLVCQTGRRSQSLLHRFPQFLEGSRRVYSLQGGIEAWNCFLQSDGQ